MIPVTQRIETEPEAARQQFIINSFTENYADLIAHDPAAWRGKFRKMSESPFAFYRGSASLFFADVARDEDPFLNEQTSRVWIQGDLHAENFGTYMNGAGVLVFDVNDFDEATVAPFTWDVKRFIASLALIGYGKAMSDAEIRDVMAAGARGYAEQIARFANGADKKFALTLDNTEGVVKEILQKARLLTRVGLLDADTAIVDGDRRLKMHKFAKPVDDAIRPKLEAAFEEYFESIPTRKRRARITYHIKDMARRVGSGIGSAGLQLFTVLLEGETQALENDILISLKIAQPAAAARFVNDERITSYFKHDGHRTTVSQRALQTNADPFLGHTTLDGQGMFVTEVSPYTADLDWDDVNDLGEVLQLTEMLGRCVAKIHCCSDDDSDQTLVSFSTEEAINGVIAGREEKFVNYLMDFGESYGAIVRHDHRLFVDAFRNRQIPAV